MGRNVYLIEPMIENKASDNNSERGSSDNSESAFSGGNNIDSVENGGSGGMRSNDIENTSDGVEDSDGESESVGSIWTDSGTYSDPIGEYSEPDMGDEDEDDDDDTEIFEYGSKLHIFKEMTLPNSLIRGKRSMQQEDEEEKEGETDDETSTSTRQRRRIKFCESTGKIFLLVNAVLFLETSVILVWKKEKKNLSMIVYSL